MTDYSPAPQARVLDQAGVIISLLCILHCFSLPLAFALLPAATHGLAAPEWVHVLLVMLAVPVALRALGRGRQVHKSARPIQVGVPGLMALLAALVAHEPHWLETALTTCGAGLMILAHLWNDSLISGQRTP